MTELDDALKELEMARPKKKPRALALLAAATIILAIALGAWLVQSQAVNAFPLEGSYVCTFHGKEYMVHDGTYFYLDGDSLVVVSDGEMTTIAPGEEPVAIQAPEDFFLSAPGASCIENPEPEKIMEEASVTGVVSFGGKEYALY